MNRSPLHLQIDTLPGLAATMVDDLVRKIADLLPPQRCREFQTVLLGGCGDSHHAAVNAEMAFWQLAALPCRAAPAMQLGRYIIPELAPDSAEALVVAISVSGKVSRTVELLELAQQAGTTTLAVTGSRRSPLAAAADLVLHTAVPQLKDESRGVIVPGARSYIASQLALYALAIHLGQSRENLSKKAADDLRRELAEMAGKMETTIAATSASVAEAVNAWLDAGTYVFCGSGPNYGTALFSAAKLLEATGDSAVAQEIEEWAHLEYFAREVGVATFVISAAGRDEDRAMEVAAAAAAVGRRLAVIAPPNSRLLRSEIRDYAFPVAGPVRECFSPLITCLPGLLFAAGRQASTGESYFRGFSGGRSTEGGGGISRIRTSDRLRELPH